MGKEWDDVCAIARSGVGQLQFQKVKTVTRFIKKLKDAQFTPGTYDPVHRMWDRSYEHGNKLVEVTVLATPMCRRLSWGVSCEAYTKNKDGGLRLVDWTGVLVRRNTLCEFVRTLPLDAECAVNALQTQLHKRRKKYAD